MPFYVALRIEGILPLGGSVRTLLDVMNSPYCMAQNGVFNDRLVQWILHLKKKKKTLQVYQIEFIAFATW